MKGLLFVAGTRFTDALQPVLEEMQDLHWLISAQTWPWHGIHATPDPEATEVAIEGYRIEVPDLDGSYLYRAGLLREWGGFLGVDEYSYFLGISGSIEDAIGVAETWKTTQDPEPHLVNPPPAVAAWLVSLGDAGGPEDYFWAAYFRDPALLDRLRRRYGGREVDSDHGFAGQAPVAGLT